MKNDRGMFLCILIITIVAVLLIIANPTFHLNLPFSVEFLIGYVGCLLIYILWHSVYTKGWRISLLMLGISFLIAFTAEAVGVNYGLIFGNYHYTATLGLQLFGVPFLAALTWEPILYASFCMTDILVPVSQPFSANRKKYIVLFLWMSLLGAMATTAWDMMIDPIAISQGWWVWEKGGAYVPYIQNGVPISNYLGWLGVSFTILLINRFLIAKKPPIAMNTDVSFYGPLTLYASLFLTSFGVALTVLDHPEVALIGFMAMGPFLVIALTNQNVINHGLLSQFGVGKSVDQ